jgi:hypothetical protein
MRYFKHRRVDGRDASRPVSAMVLLVLLLLARVGGVGIIKPRIRRR